MPLAWAVPITVCRLCWAKTRSTATTDGPCSSMTARSPAAIVARRCSIGRAGIGADDADVHERRGSVGRDIHHPHAAAGQPGVDAEHSERAASDRDATPPR